MAHAILTIGHSTRSLEELAAMLKAHGATLLVDVRTIPRSRTNPQFNRETLGASLQAYGIGYVYEPRLGGLRRARADSSNTVWKNASFRGYADYMETPEFDAAVDDLVKLPGSPAIMCAEAVPWRCHRNLVADALLARGVPTAHIMSESKVQPHTLTSFARVEGGRVRYGDQTQSHVRKQ